MNEKKEAAFPGGQPVRPPLQLQPLCHFEDWRADVDAFAPRLIGSAADGPDTSGKPLDYAKYLIYAFDLANRRVWAQVDSYMEASSGGIDGYVARPVFERNGIHPRRFWLDLANLRNATVQHRTGRAPSSLHTDRCDHPLVRNGRILADHKGHECYELYLCRHRAEDLCRIARRHGKECTYWQLRIDEGLPGEGDLCDDDGKQRAFAAMEGAEHAYVKRVSDGEIVATQVRTEVIR